ncbi:MAG: glycosyltransferase, partial [Lachnospiraceae bacterium]|nr:glycosyltransferase [Lachnospiraceae bacterium]
CMAAPLLLGAGIKVKVLEAMSAGVPVLTNDIGIEGIGCRPGQEYLHCETPQDYSAAVIWMEQNPQQAAQMAAAGKRYIAEKFDLEDRYEKLLITWDDLLDDKGR